MRTMCSREIFTKKCRQQQIFDSDLKGAWHYNHVTFTPIAKNFMLYCRLIYMLSILCVRLTIKVKVGIPESFKVGWYPPPKKLGRVTLSDSGKKKRKREKLLSLKSPIPNPLRKARYIAALVRFKFIQVFLFFRYTVCGETRRTKTMEMTQTNRQRRHFRHMVINT